MAKNWEKLTKDEQEDIKNTMRKQKEADEIEELMSAELDKCRKEESK